MIDEELWRKRIKKAYENVEAFDESTAAFDVLKYLEENYDFPGSYLKMRGILHLIGDIRHEVG